MAQDPESVGLHGFAAQPECDDGGMVGLVSMDVYAWRSEFVR